MSITVTWAIILVSVLNLPLTTASAGRSLEDSRRDKTGTTQGLPNNTASQTTAVQGLARRFSFSAEGMGFEPTTPFGAPDFEKPLPLQKPRKIRRI
jgi:hypothetical protein